MIKDKKKMGAPRKEIDFRVFEELCKIQCTETEIANVLEVDIDTLCARIREQYGENKTFSEIYKRFADFGKMSLRRIQFKQAVDSPAMAIWLGKQYLDQKDKVEVDNDILINEELEFKTAPLNKGNGKHNSKYAKRFSKFINN